MIFIQSLLSKIQFLNRFCCKMILKFLIILRKQFVLLQLQGKLIQILATSLHQKKCLKNKILIKVLF